MLGVHDSGHQPAYSKLIHSVVRHIPAEVSTTAHSTEKSPYCRLLDSTLIVPQHFLETSLFTFLLLLLESTPSQGIGLYGRLFP